jgi:hypothetical protein
MKVMAIVGPIIFALIWMGFGIFAFFLIHSWGVEYDHKLETIKRGEVKPITLYVTDLSENKKSRNWNVAIGVGGKAVAWRSPNDVAGLQLGSPVTAYRFGDNYLIPQFDRGGHHWGEWIFLAFGMLPLPIIGVIILVSLLRGRHRRSASDQSTQTSSRGGLATSEQHPTPRAFSRSSMTFDHAPGDCELTCLLGDPNCGPVRAVEEGGVLTVRPWLFPMKYIVPWMIFTAIVITCMLCFAPMIEHKKTDFSSVLFFWLPLCLVWLLGLPAFLGFLAILNRTFASKGDYFKVDMARRTLELCRLARTVKAGDIIAITLLTRWYRNAGGASFKTYQTGVLVRSPENNNRVELYPVVRELGENIPASRASQWAERLANIFQVPIRRTELSRSESLALDDR